MTSVRKNVFSATKVNYSIDEAIFNYSLAYARSYEAIIKVLVNVVAIQGLDSFRVRVFFCLVPKGRRTYSVNARCETYEVLGVSLKVVSSLLYSLLLVLTKFVTLRDANRVASTSYMKGCLALVVPRFYRQHASYSRQ